MLRRFLPILLLLTITNNHHIHCATKNPSNIINTKKTQNTENEDLQDANNQKDPSLFNKTVNWTKEKYITIKNKIKPYITPNNIILTTCFLYFAYSAANEILTYKKNLKSLQNAPHFVKEYVILLAQKLHIKNPEKINVKVIYSADDFLNFSDMFGNIVLNKKTCENLYSNEAMFIIGHELCHYKHNDAIKKLFSKLALQLTGLYIYAKYNPLRSLNNSKTIQTLKIKEKATAYTGLAMMQFIAFNKIITSLCNITLAQSLGKFSEFRADLVSASLGRKSTTGGIRLFKHLQKISHMLWTKRTWIQRLTILLSDEHPSITQRINYLKWYRHFYYSLLKSVKIS